MNYEIIGITGSVMIILAFTFKGEKKIRIADAVGAGLFIVYGLLIKSFSTVFLNVVLVAVQAYHLFIRGVINGE